MKAIGIEQHRARVLGRIPESRLADAEREIDAVWVRCDVWELTRGVCELARNVAPAKVVRALDALHLATFVLARRSVEGLKLLSTDQRLLDASVAV